MSKRKFFYDTLEDSDRKLRDSVVSLVDGTPVYVNRVTGLNTDQCAEVVPLPYNHRELKAQTFPLTDKYFSIRNIPTLGYVDTQSHSFYLSRKPARQWKQGLCQANVYIPEAPIYEARRPTFPNLLASKAFVNMLLEKYPYFKDTFEQVIKSDEPLMKAISKTMAISIDDMESVSLWHRGIKVGVANNPRKYGPLFNLPRKFTYLKEELDDHGIKVEAA